MTKVNIQEAKTHLSRYVDRVEQGEVVIVCRHNKPVAELRSIVDPPGPPPRPIRVPGLLKGQIHWEPNAFDPMSDAETAAEFDGSILFPNTQP